MGIVVTIELKVGGRFTKKLKTLVEIMKKHRDIIINESADIKASYPKKNTGIYK